MCLDGLSENPKGQKNRLKRLFEPCFKLSKDLKFWIFFKVIFIFN